MDQKRQWHGGIWWHGGMVAWKPGFLHASCTVNDGDTSDAAVAAAAKKAKDAEKGKANKERSEAKDSEVG